MLPQHLLASETLDILEIALASFPLAYLYLLNVPAPQLWRLQQIDSVQLEILQFLVYHQIHLGSLTQGILPSHIHR